MKQTMTVSRSFEKMTTCGYITIKEREEPRKEWGQM